MMLHSLLLLSAAAVAVVAGPIETALSAFDPCVLRAFQDAFVPVESVCVSKQPLQDKGFQPKFVPKIMKECPFHILTDLNGRRDELSSKMDAACSQIIDAAKMPPSGPVSAPAHPGNDMHSTHHSVSTGKASVPTVSLHHGQDVTGSAHYVLTTTKMHSTKSHHSKSDRHHHHTTITTTITLTANSHKKNDVSIAPLADTGIDTLANEVNNDVVMTTTAADGSLKIVTKHNNSAKHSATATATTEMGDIPMGPLVPTDVAATVPVQVSPAAVASSTMILVSLPASRPAVSPPAIITTGTAYQTGSVSSVQQQQGAGTSDAAGISAAPLLSVMLAMVLAMAL